MGGAEAGTYTVDFTVVEPAKGTIHIVTIPAEVADSIDFVNTDTDTIIQQVLDSAI